VRAAVGAAWVLACCSPCRCQVGLAEVVPGTQQIVQVALPPGRFGTGLEAFLRLGTDKGTIVFESPACDSPGCQTDRLGRVTIATVHQVVAG
jgi:hypothetical protein